MISTESLWNILREFGWKRCLRSGQKISISYVSEYMGKCTEELCKVLHSVGSYLKSRKECDEYSVFGNQGFAQLQCMMLEKRVFSIVVTYAYTSRCVVPRIRYPDTDNDVFDNMRIDALIRSSRKGDELHKGMYDLSCVYAHTPPLDGGYARSVDGHFRNEYWCTEEKLNDIAQSYVSWNGVSDVSGKTYDKFPVPMLLSNWSENYLHMFADWRTIITEDYPHTFTWSWNLSNMNYGAHVLHPSTALVYHGIMPKFTGVPTFWTQYKLLNNVSLPFARFMYRPYLDNVTEITYDEEFNHILVPSVERCVVELLTMQTYLDEEFFRRAMCSCMKSRCDLDEVLRVNRLMKTGHLYFDLTDIELMSRIPICN